MSIFRSAAICLVLCAAIPPGVAAAEQLAENEPATQRATIEAALARLAPQLQISAVRASAMPELLEVEAGGQLFYISADGRHLIQGSMIDTVKRRDLTEARRESQRAAALRALPEAQIVRFEAAQPEHRVTVFTALECGYCKRFHSEIEAYLDAGISVDYVLIPMRGEGSEGDLNGARLFCAADRQDAFTRATAGQQIEGPVCESGYSAGKALAVSLGINTTPTVVLADGRKSGYLTPAELAQRLDEPREEG